MALVERGDIPIGRRVQELIDDGYLLRGRAPNTIIVSIKGLLVLCADADRSVDKTKLIKTSVAFEREQAKTRKKAF